MTTAMQGMFRCLLTSALVALSCSPPPPQGSFFSPPPDPFGPPPAYPPPQPQAYAPIPPLGYALPPPQGYAPQPNTYNPQYYPPPPSPGFSLTQLSYQPQPMNSRPLPPLPPIAPPRDAAPAGSSGYATGPVEQEFEGDPYATGGGAPASHSQNSVYGAQDTTLLDAYHSSNSNGGSGRSQGTDLMNGVVGAYMINEYVF
ncbi:uncharacterized protein LOC131937275 [Physella acuta]|uniref:uncharacterized protein LOC131937275 n=1 Tax=Physella acuta TaxID=109671 RepID=UPI0027DD86C4|nr:uncharacterized protein LOC131937275 [Physella acuta]